MGHASAAAAAGQDRQRPRTNPPSHARRPDALPEDATPPPARPGGRKYPATWTRAQKVRARRAEVVRQLAAAQAVLTQQTAAIAAPPVIAAELVGEGRGSALSPALSPAHERKEMRAWLRDRYADPVVRAKVEDDILLDRSARGFYFKEAHPPAAHVERVSDSVAIAASSLSPNAAQALALFVARASGGAPAAGVTEIESDSDTERR